MTALVSFSTILLKVLLATLLTTAGLMKLATPKQSINLVKRYGLGSKPVAVLVGLALPIVEVALAPLLLVPTTSTIAFAASTVLFGGFLTAIIFNLLRGNDVPCGCFGQVSKEPINWRTAVRTAMFFLASGVGAVAFTRVSAPDEAGFSILGATVVGGAFLAVVGTGFAIWSAMPISAYASGGTRTLSRRGALKVSAAFTAAVATLLFPISKAEAGCCHCQKYDHFELGRNTVLPASPLHVPRWSSTW